VRELINSVTFTNEERGDLDEIKTLAVIYKRAVCNCETSGRTDLRLIGSKFQL